MNTIRPADAKDLEALVPLFDAYRVFLATQAGNRIAQGLYAGMGYRREDGFFHYSLTF